MHAIRSSSTLNESSPGKNGLEGTVGQLRHENGTDVRIQQLLVGDEDGRQSTLRKGHRALKKGAHETTCDPSMLTSQEPIFMLCEG